MIAFRGSFSASMSKLVHMSKHVLALEKKQAESSIFTLSFEWQMQLVSLAKIVADRVFRGHFSRGTER